jgi:cell division protein FtsQ
MARNRLTQRRKSDARPGAGAGSVWAAALAVLKGLAAVGMGLGLAVGALSAWEWASTSERFAVKRVEVLGAQRATESELVTLSGLSARPNLFKLDTQAVEKAVAAHPWVQSVSVERRWPDGVVLTVGEHQPRAVLAAGELYLVNQDGAPFKRLQAGDEAGLTLVTGVDREVLAQDRQQAVQALRRALEVDAAYARLVGTPALSEVHLEGEAVTIFTVEGTEVRLGEGDVGPQLRRLKTVQRALGGGAAALAIHLDNRLAPHRVTVLPASPRQERGGSAGKDKGRNGHGQAE